jgi:hypothetical protein
MEDRELHKRINGLEKTIGGRGGGTMLVGTPFERDTQSGWDYLAFPKFQTHM